MEFRKFAVVEKQFDYKGHDCICIFNHLGFRCGYVSVSTDKDYDEYDIDCHGGLTFSGVLPYDYGQNYQYYIGFDCGHFGDGIDYNEAFEYGLIGNEAFEYFSSRNLWSLYPAMTLDFVIEQCKHIVDQLERKEKGNEKI